jgi:class 3 adenylate cyclase
VAELPSGTVTFLFTDIEGSTRLVKPLRDRYGELHAEHQRLLREAFDPSVDRAVGRFVSRRVGDYQYNAYSGTLLDQLWVK